jgi:hypothetical protein
VRVLEQLAAERGLPAAIRVDHALNAREKFQMSTQGLNSTQEMRAVDEIGFEETRFPEMVFHEIRDPAHHNEHKICAGARP